MADDSTNPTVQRQEQGKTVYLEQLPGGGYHETTTPGGGGGGAQGPTITFNLTVPEPKPEEVKFSGPDKSTAAKTTETTKNILILPEVSGENLPKQNEAVRKYLAEEPLTVNDLGLLGYNVQQRLPIEHKGGQYGAGGSLEGKTTANLTGNFGAYTITTTTTTTPGEAGALGPAAPQVELTGAKREAWGALGVKAANEAAKAGQAETDFLNQNPELGEPARLFLRLPQRSAPGGVALTELYNVVPETEREKQIRADQERYASQMPGGSNFGFGFGKLTMEALEKSRFSPNEKAFIQSTGGIVPETIDIVAQAAKNTPAAFGAITQNPVKFTTEGGAFILGSVAGQGQELIDLPGRVARGEPGAPGQLLGTGAVLGTSFILHVRGINAAADAKINAKLAASSAVKEARLKAENKVPIGYRYSIQKTAKGTFEESGAFVLADNPGVNIIEGEARGTYYKQITNIKIDKTGKGTYTTLIKSGEVPLTSSATEAPFAITAGEGPVMSPKEAFAEVIKGKSISTPEATGEIATPEGFFSEGSLIPGAIRRSAAFNKIFGKGEIETPITPLAERLEIRGTQRYFYKAELGKETPKEINFLASSELPGAKPTPEVFGLSDIILADKQGGLSRVRGEIELPDVVKAIEITKKAEAPKIYLTKEGPVFVKEPNIIGDNIDTSIDTGAIGKFPEAKKIPLKFEVQLQQQVTIPKAFLEGAKVQALTEAKTATTTKTQPKTLQFKPFRMAEQEEEDYTTRPGTIQQTRQLTRGMTIDTGRTGTEWRGRENERGIIGPNIDINQKPTQRHDIKQKQNQAEKQLFRDWQIQKGLTMQKEGLTNKEDITQKTFFDQTQQGITLYTTLAREGMKARKKIPVIEIPGGDDTKKGGWDDKVLRKFKLPKFRTKAGLQPMLTPREKLSQEIKTGGPVRGLIKSTARTREIYRGAMLGGLFKSGLLNTKRRRKK